MRLALVFVALLAGCQTPCVAPAPHGVTVRFECADGSQVVATFATDRVRIVQPGHVTVELPARWIGAGYRYAGGGAELRRQAQGVQWARPGAANTLCQRAS